MFCVLFRPGFAKVKPKRETDRQAGKKRKIRERPRGKPDCKSRCLAHTDTGYGGRTGQTLDTQSRQPGKRVVEKGKLIFRKTQASWFMCAQMFSKMHLCGRDTFVAESVSERYIPTKGAVSTVSLWLAESLRSGCILLPLQGHFALEFDQQPLLSKPVWLKDYYESFLASSDCYLLVGNPKSKCNFYVLACPCISQPSFCLKYVCQLRLTENETKEKGKKNVK